MTDPFEGVDVRVFAFDICVASAAAFDPCFVNRAERRKVVLAVLHECQVCDERDVYAETRKGFNEASQPLRRRIQNPLHTRRIVETVAEGSVFLGIGPIRNRPRIVISTDAEKRLRGPLRLEIHEFAPNRQRGRLARLP